MRPGSSLGTSCLMRFLMAALMVRSTSRFSAIVTFSKVSR